MSTRRPVVFSLSIVVLSLLVTTGLAQETTGNIEGRLVDSDGNAVAFANVNVTSPSLQGGRGVMSTSDGYFGIFKLPVGIYTVKISHVSYNEVTYAEVSVRLGRTTTLGKVTLTVKTFEAPAIIVTEKRPLIDPTSTAIGANLTSENLRNLPLDRNYQNIPALLPHANERFAGEGVNFAGATIEENKYFVDGVETSDAQFGTGGTVLPYNFLEEIQVKMGGYEAEYRSSLGGVVNAISRSGGNEFHGQIFGFFVNNQFVSEPRLSFSDPPETDFAQYDVGMSLSGPISKDKLWFFAAYNPIFSTEDVEIPGIGWDEDKTVTHAFAGKFTWKATNRTDVNLTVTGDPGKRNQVWSLWDTSEYLNPDVVLADVTSGGVNVAINGTHLFSDAFFIESALSRIMDNTKVESPTALGRDEVTYLDRETGIASGGLIETSDANVVQVTAGVKATFIMGRHMLKTGLEYRDSRLDFSSYGRIVERYDDTTYTDIVFANERRDVQNRIPSVFVQDSWRVTDDLRVNAGLRWDGQFIVGSDGEVAQTITDQYQPRFGVVYEPGEPGTQKIFATAGRFYQEFHLELANRAYNDGYLLRGLAYDHDPRLDPTGGVEIFSSGAAIQDEVDGLEGQHYDEYSVGYERQIGHRFTVGARGIYRALRQGAEDANVILPDGTTQFVMGNPGKGLLGDYPEMKREYTALEVTAQVFGGGKYDARASYVLSRLYGNYAGIGEIPNFTAAFDFLETMENSTGKLENDRTHVFKLSGSYQVGHGFAAGAWMLWQSGTPLSVIEGSSIPGWPKQAQERGSAGRTPTVWDVNMRLVYDLAAVAPTPGASRLILDILHVGSQREPVDFDQVTNFGENGTFPNQTYGLATRYQPPMAVRVGVEVDF